METLLANLTGKTHRAVWQGRNYIVAPLTLIVPGVLNGSKGALYYPSEEIRKDPSVWNHVPIVVYHPTHNGEHVSARDPAVLEKQGIGHVFRANARNKAGKLVAEGWFDEEKTKQVDNRIYEKLVGNQPIELSTGLFTDNDLADNGAHYKGRSYQYTARNYRPDHLAILPDQVGACSLQDGCGVMVNERAKRVIAEFLTGNFGETLPAPPSTSAPAPTKQKKPKKLKAAGVSSTEAMTRIQGGPATNQPRQLEDGQFSPTSGAAVKQTSTAAAKGFSGEPKSAALVGEPNVPAGDGRGTAKLTKVAKVKDFDGDEDIAEDGENRDYFQESVDLTNAFEPVRDDHGRFASGSGGDASKEAHKKTLDAFDSTNSGRVAKSIKLHQEAAAAHHDAAKANSGDAARAAHHIAKAEVHEKQAQNHKDQYHGVPGKGSNPHPPAHNQLKLSSKLTHRGAKMTKEQFRSILTSNCKCEEDKAALNQLSDETLNVMYGNLTANAEMKAVGSAAGVVGAPGADVQAGGEEDDEEALATPGTEVAVKAKKVAPAAAAMNSRITLAQWESSMPEEAKAIWNTAKSMERAERARIVQHLVSHIADENQRKLVGNQLFKKPVDELRLLSSIVPTQRQVANFQQEREESYTNYLGAIGGPIGNQTQVDNAADDILDMPTLNFQDLVASQKKEVG